MLKFRKPVARMCYVLCHDLHHETPHIADVLHYLLITRREAEGG